MPGPLVDSIVLSVICLNIGVLEYWSGGAMDRLIKLDIFCNTPLLHYYLSIDIFSNVIIFYHDTVCI